jgi:hypothetical protein
VSTGYDEHDEDEGGPDTPPTRSYVDALLKGNMTPSQVASLRAEIAREPIEDEGDLRAPAAPHLSSVPPRGGYASSVPPRDVARGPTTGLRPPEPPPPRDEDDVRTVFRTYTSASPGAATPPHGIEAVDEVDDGWGSIPLPPSQPPPPLDEVDFDLGTLGPPSAPPYSRPLVDIGPPSVAPPHSRPLVDIGPPSVAPPYSRPFVDLGLGSPSVAPPRSSPVVELDLGDDDDDARTMMRLPGAYNTPSQRPAASAPSVPAPPVESLDETYLRALGGSAGIPRVAVSPDALTQHPLGVQAGFVVSRLDGESTIEDLLDISGLPRLETLRILYELVQDSIVSIAPPR